MNGEETGAGKGTTLNCSLGLWAPFPPSRAERSQAEEPRRSNVTSR